MTTKTWLIFAAVCVAIIGGMVWMSQGNSINIDDVDAHTIQTGNDKNGNIGDHILGPDNAKVVIVEYGDYQCPGCKQVAPMLKAVQAKYSDNVALIFRNFPLVTAHPNARAAAASAEAAALQNEEKYWDMFTTIYQNQEAWSGQNGQTRTDTFASYATQLGLDRDRFINDLTSPDIAKKIDFDTALGRKVGVTGTPTIYVNGEEANQYVKDGKVVDRNEDGAANVWTSQNDFEKIVLIPALEKAGVKLEDEATKTE